MNGEIDPVSNIQIMFNKDVLFTGNWTASFTCYDETMAIPSDVPEINDNILSFAIDLPSYVFCSLSIEEGSIMDHNGNIYMDTIVLPFHTKDIIAPTITMELSPIADLTEASRITDISFIIDDQSAVELNNAIDGGISIHTSTEVYLYTIDKLSMVNNTITILNETPFALGEEVTIHIPNGLIKDSNNNVNEAKQFTFTVTEVTTQPLTMNIITTTLYTTDILQIQFDSAIATGSGFLSLQGVQVNHGLPIPVSTCDVMDTVLRCPFMEAIEGAEYTVIVHAGNVVNILGNPNAETVLTQTISIITVQIPSLVMNECSPKEGDISISINGTLSLKWDQPVQLKDTCTLQVSGYETPSSLHTVELIAITTGLASTQEFMMNELLPFTQYTLTIPAECMENAIGTSNELIQYSFTTTHLTAPSLLTFNLESEQDVLLDAVLRFTFDQPLLPKEGAMILLKPRDLASIERTIDVFEDSVAFVYNQDASLRLSSKTQYTVYIPEGTFCNCDNMCMEAMTLSSFTTVTESVARVILQHSIPFSGATHVDASTPVTLTFSGNVRPSSGATNHYYIYQEENEIEGTAEFDGKQVHLTFPLESGKTYTYVYNNNLFTTNKGSPVYYDIGSSFSFTVADTEGPIHYSFSVDNMQSIEILFNENVIAGNGVLTITNSNNESVLAPISANTVNPDNRVVIYISGSSLPDDVYTFTFAAGFVKDSYGNESPAFTETYELDRVAFEIKEIIAPTTVFDAITIVTSKEIQSRTGNFILDGLQRCIISTLNLPINSQSRDHIYISPLACGNSVWTSNTTYVLTIPVSTLNDMKNNTLAVEYTTDVIIPAMGSLEIDGDNSVPLMNSVNSINYLLGMNITIAFTDAIEVISSVSLRNNEGCILATGEQMIVDGKNLIFTSIKNECLTGTIALIATEGAITSMEAGSQISASTLSNPLYSFTFMSAGPKPVSATAVYGNGLQIAANARIDIVFDNEIYATETTLHDLTFLQFLDSENKEVGFAQRYHGEIEGSILHVIVDEPYNPLLTQQIRSITILPLSNEYTLTGLGTDIAIGSISLSRLFSLPPVSTQLQLVNDNKSIKPTLSIIFNQAVMKSEGACDAILVSDSIRSYSISIEAITTIDSMHFTWTPSYTELLQPETDYSFVVDNSCFIVVDSNTAATGVSSSLAFTTLEDTIGPFLLGASSTRTSEVSMNILVQESFIYLHFNEKVAVNRAGIVVFMNENSNEVIQIPASRMQVEDEDTLVSLTIYGRLLSNTIYSVRIENAIKDTKGNMMEPMTTPIRVVTGLTSPNYAENIKVTPITNNIDLISFDASIDKNLRNEVGTCTYIIERVSNTNDKITFDDFCVGPFYEGEPIRLGKLIILNDPFDLRMYRLYTHNAYSSTLSSTFAIFASTDVEAGQQIDEAPMIPKVLYIQTLADKPEEREILFFMPPSVSFTHHIGYTFMIESGSYHQLIDMVENTTHYTYSIHIPSSLETITIRVKSTSENGSSPFSEKLTLNVATDSTAPASIDLNSITMKQLSASKIQVSWIAPVCQEYIFYYLLTFNEHDPITTNNTSIELPVFDTLIEFDIQAVTNGGASIPTHVRLEISTQLTATVQSMYTGSTFAVATFETSYENVNVECAINAGQLIHAIGTIVNANEVRVVMNGLIPSFHYSGLCWAFALNSKDVSDSISISFTTSTVTEEAHIVAENLSFETQEKATIEVNIDTPATVYCLIVENGTSIVHSDIVVAGSKIDLALDGPKTLELSNKYFFPGAVYCTAENSMHKKVGSIVSVSILRNTVPYVIANIDFDCTVKHEDTDVSIHPLMQCTFPGEIDLYKVVFIFENMRTHEKIEIAQEAVLIEGTQITIHLPHALEYNSLYSFYFTGDISIYNRLSLFNTKMLRYGEYQFSTTSINTPPTLLTPTITMDPSNSIVLEFNRPILIHSEKEVILSNNQFNHIAIPHVDDKTVFYNVKGLVENMNYTLTIPECAIEDIYGNCFSATEITVHTTADLMNPLINSFDLANKQHVPNDLPMHFTFNENVYLNDVNHVVVVANTHVISLTNKNIMIDGKDVTIQLDQGYNMGYSGLDDINVRVLIEEDAFRDLAGRSNEMFESTFTAVPQRCGSSYLSTFMENACKCHNQDGKCWCKCGLVNLFEL